MNFLKLFLIFLIFSAKSYAAQDKKIKIATSINPIYQIVLFITKDKDNTSLLIKPEFSEHDHKFKKQDLLSFFKADLVFYIDDNLERSFAKLVKGSKKKNRAFELSKAPKIKLLLQKGLVKKVNYHLWLDPDNSVAMAEFITKKISELDWENSAKYFKNLADFKEKNAKNTKNIKKILSKIDNPSHVVFYDSYQYFEEYFKINPALAILNNHDSELKFKDIKKFKRILKAKKATCVLGDYLDEKSSALKLATNNDLKFFKLNLFGQESEDYFSITNNIADKINSCYDNPFAKGF